MCTASAESRPIPMARSTARSRNISRIHQAPMALRHTSLHSIIMATSGGAKGMIGVLGDSLSARPRMGRTRALPSMWFLNQAAPFRQEAVARISPVSEWIVTARSGLMIRSVHDMVHLSLLPLPSPCISLMDVLRVIAIHMMAWPWTVTTTSGLARCLQINWLRLSLAQ